MKVTLTAKQQAAPGVITFVLQPAEPVSWQAGQYMHYILEHDNPDDRGTERWFTIASSPYEGHLQITTRFAPEHGSTFKTALGKLNSGDQLEADGPEGEFTLSDTSRPSILISGGIGVTPYHSILRQLDHDGKPLSATLLYANRTPDFIFKAELDALAGKHPEFHIRYLIDPERIDEQVIRAAAPNLDEPTFYISGPEPMVKAMAVQLEGMGVPERRIKLDDFPGYEAHD